MRTKGVGFARDANQSLPALATSAPEKPLVVFVAHQRVLIDRLAASPELTEHMGVRNLIRENASTSVLSHESIEHAMQGASGLVLCPCRSSMYPSTISAAAESYALELASQATLPIVVCVCEKANAFPPYMEKFGGQVDAVVTFGLNLTQMDTGYLRAWHCDLFVLPKTEKAMADGRIRLQQSWEHFPENASAFARTFAEMARLKMQLGAN